MTEAEPVSRENHFLQCQQNQQRSLQGIETGYQQQISTHISSQQNYQPPPTATQQQQQHQEEDEQYDEYDEGDEYQEEYPYDPTFDIASDDVRLARGLVFAAPQVDWAAAYITNSQMDFPIFTAKQPEKETLPSGLPIKHNYTDNELSFLIGNLSYESLNDNEVEMAEVQRARNKNRTKKINVQRKPRPAAQTKKTVTISDTIQIATTSGIMTRQVTASTAPVVEENAQQAPPKSKYLEDLLQKLSLKGKTRMGDLNSKDLEEIRNNKEIPSSFKHSILKTYQSGKVNKMQLISDYKLYLQTKKNDRAREKSVTSSESSV